MRRSVAFVGLLIVAASLLYAACYMRGFGEPEHTAMDDYFINNAQNETGASNVVSSIVFDYRGYDTLGEATVLFSAVTGVLVAVRRSLKRGMDVEKGMDAKKDNGGGGS